MLYTSLPFTHLDSSHLFPPSVLSIVFYAHGLTKGWFVGCREEPAGREARRGGFYGCADRLGQDLSCGGSEKGELQGSGGCRAFQVWEQYRNREALVSAGRIQ